MEMMKSGINYDKVRENLGVFGQEAQRMIDTGEPGSSQKLLGKTLMVEIERMEDSLEAYKHMTKMFKKNLGGAR